MIFLVFLPYCMVITSETANIVSATRWTTISIFFHPPPSLPPILSYGNFYEPREKHKVINVTSKILVEFMNGGERKVSRVIKFKIYIIYAGVLTL